MTRSAAIGRFFRSRWWRVGRFVLGLGLGLLALSVLNGQRGELVGASAELAHLRLGWLLVAIASEVISYFAFGQMQRRLLHAGQVRISLRYATGLSLAAGAIANSLPAGPAFASLYAFRLYRRAGANDVLAGWTLVASLVCASLTLGIVATVGVALALRESSSYGLGGVIFGVLIISVLADAIVLQRTWLIRLLTHALGVSRSLTGWPHRHGAEVVESITARLRGVQPTSRDLFGTMGSALGNWLFDCGALAASFLAVGVGVPWRGLLLTYGAAQLAVNLPITPGGLGVVEGTITIALVAFGGAERSIVAAVLCYRVISFWGALPVGWVTWAGLGVWHRRSDRLASATATSVASQPVEDKVGSV